MNQKLENQLQLALETPASVREQTQDLNTGYDAAEETWEIIVKYHGNLDRARQLGAVVEELIGGYAVLTVSVDVLDAIAALEEIEYIEKPKRMYYAQMQPREGSCIYPVTLQAPYLTGRGVLTAVLDSGISIERREFRWPDGGTRILYLWDQSYRPDESTNFPEGFAQGAEFSREQINESISAMESRDMWITFPQREIPGRDISGHGTAVSGIFAASNVTAELSPNASQIFVENALNDIGGYVGIAPESEFLIVKLGIPGENSFPRTTEIMRGVTYVINKALALERPLVINLSIGNTYGAHERYN